MQILKLFENYQKGYSDKEHFLRAVFGEQDR